MLDGREATPPAGDRGSVARRYWRANLRILAALLVVWFVVSFGCGILFVEPLNKLRIGEAPLGFWFAQQGAIYVFVVLIAVYVVLLNRLERRLGLREV
ncbi:MAG: hypothetical protein CMJ31_15015 [Phycisphaerae bacterium]|nr:hypothetical protein [Phycisphaerae bacterium]